MEHPREQVHPVPEERPGAVHGYGPYPLLAIRSIVGGIFLGLVSVIHGMEGAPMLVAAGIYPYFVLSVADFAGLRPSRRSLLIVGVTLGCGVFSVLALGGLAQTVASEMRWAAYSLFVGVALGGLVVNYGMLRPMRPSTWVAVAVGTVLGVILASIQEVEPTLVPAAAPGFLALVTGGAAAAASIVIPGVSDLYLLEELGVHRSIHDAVGSLTGEGVIEVGPAIAQLLPVALGWVFGLVLLCLAIRWLLTRFERQTLGVVMGLLVGALFDAWPFRRLVPYRSGEIVDGRAITSMEAAHIPRFQFRVEGFDPTTTQAVLAGVIVLAGFLLMAMLTKFSRRRGESGLDSAARSRMSLPDRPSR